MAVVTRRRRFACGQSHRHDHREGAEGGARTQGQGMAEREGDSPVWFDCISQNDLDPPETRPIEAANIHAATLVAIQDLVGKNPDPTLRYRISGQRAIITTRSPARRVVIRPQSNS